MKKIKPVEWIEKYRPNLVYLYRFAKINWRIEKLIAFELDLDLDIKELKVFLENYFSKTYYQ